MMKVILFSRKLNKREILQTVCYGGDKNKENAFMKLCFVIVILNIEWEIIQS